MNEPGLQNRDPFGLVGSHVADKYRVEQVVGAGGFGVVYRAHHEIWDQPVALKCFTALSNAPAYMRDNLLDSFVQEGKLLSALSSKTAAIVQARDIGTMTTPTGEWLPYMVLEWLEGSPLNALLRNPDNTPVGTRRSAQEAFEILDGVARALALAHSHGVAHRDIKPDNFFVCAEELKPGVTVKVLDFGIAKVMQSQAGTALASTTTQMTSFTPNYGAPEQFDRTHGATGPWTDVFSMALVLVELMAGGTAALSGEEFMQLAFASQNPSRRPTPWGMGLEATEAVENVFKKALAVEVVNRHRNMGAFWMALASALEVKDYAPLPTEAVPLKKIVATTTGGHLAVAAAPRVTQPLGGTTRPAAVHAPGVATIDTLPANFKTELSTGPGAVEPTAPHQAAPSVTAEPPQPAAKRTLVFFAEIAVALAAVAGIIYLVSGIGSNEDPAEEALNAGIAAKKAADTGDAEGADTKKTKTKAADPGQAAASCPDGMVLVPAGDFYMGSDEREIAALKLARPAHQVMLKAYCIDLKEVTVAEYKACSDTGKCKRAFRKSYWPAPKDESKQEEWEKQREAYSELCNDGVEGRENHPVNCVMWEQARVYCEQQGKRLPSEAEWEFAARGSDGRVFPWGDDAPTSEHVNACGAECTKWRKDHKLKPGHRMYEEDDGAPGTAPVGSHPKGKTEKGLYDMVGNVFEWTADEFKAYPGGTMPDTMDLENKRVIRGGAFNSEIAAFAYPALRYPQHADSHSHGVGFRCAMTPTG